MSIYPISPREYLTNKTLLFRETNGEFQIQCPFNPTCESKHHAGHMYMGIDNGLFNCKTCNESGNLWQFAERIGDRLSDFAPKTYKQADKQLENSSVSEVIINAEDVQKLHSALMERSELIDWLVKERLLSKEVIVEAQVGYGSFYNKMWIVIPIKISEDRYFLKLRKLPDDKSEGARYIVYPRGAKHLLYGSEKMNDKPTDVVITEGEFDRLVLETNSIYAVTSTGGIGTFKEEWIESLRRVQRIYVCCDNDEPGKKGSVRIIKLLEEKLKESEIYQIDLPNLDGLKDVTDFFKQENYQPHKSRLDAFFDLAKLVPRERGVSVNARTQTPKVELITDHLSLEDVLIKTRKLGLIYDFLVEVVIAAYISTFIDREKNPVWLLVVGNPSSNKTTLVFLLRYAPDCYRLDTMTQNPFSSGQKEADKPKDLLPLINDKCFIVKDYSTLFGRNEEVVRQFVTDLVAIYDGEYTKHSPNRGTVRYESLFSHIGCITPLAINKRQAYMNMVGARFLQMNVARLTDEQRADGLKVLWSNDKFVEMEREAAVAVSSFCVQLKSRLPTLVLEKESEEIIEKLNSLADLTAHARGIVMTEARNFKDNEGNAKTHYETTDTQIEEPFRALFQLRKLCRALAVVRGKTMVTMDEITTVRWIALSSMPCRRSEVLQTFQGASMQTAKEVAEKLGKDWRTVKRHLDELSSLKVLDSKKEANDLARQYFPVEKFQDIICNHI